MFTVIASAKVLKFGQTAKFFVDARGVGENYFFQEEKVRDISRYFLSLPDMNRSTPNPTSPSENRKLQKDMR